MASSLPWVAPALEAGNSHLHFPQQTRLIASHSLHRRRFLPISKWAASASSSSSSSPTVEPKQEEEKDNQPTSIDALHRFFDLNLGNWSGSFFRWQYDSHGNLLQEVTRRLAVRSYGEDELISLIQTLYIKQPPSATFVSGSDPDPEWMGVQNQGNQNVYRGQVPAGEITESVSVLMKFSSIDHQCV